MKEMYEKYKDVAVFRIVYIREAHAADGNRPVDYAKEMDINQHKTYGDRCAVAEKLINDKELKIPAIIETMENKVDKDYGGAPTRAYLVRKDGKLGVAGRRGPGGLKPALEEINEWLKRYKETGEEPELSPKEQAKEVAGEKEK